MNVSKSLTRHGWALAAGLVWCGAMTLNGQPAAQVAPAGGPLTTSKTKYVRFRFVYHRGQGMASVQSGRAEFRPTDSAGAGTNCRIDFSTSKGARVERPCVAVRKAVVRTLPNGDLEASAYLAFAPPFAARRKTVHLYTSVAGSAWAKTADYELVPGEDSSLPVTVEGVTATQVVLSFSPPDAQAACTVAVTSVFDGTNWDYSQLVPDTDTGVFPNADNANVYDLVNGPQNRGTQGADGVRTGLLPLAFRLALRGQSGAVGNLEKSNSGIL